MKKTSFLSRLMGQTDAEQYDDFLDSHEEGVIFTDDGVERRPAVRSAESDDASAEPGGELAVDVYQTPDAIVVKAFIAGVQPATVDISLTREMVTISGTRTEEKEVDEDNYFHRELYWGSFSRTILLPEEIDVDMAEATEKHGILMVRLPKINKKRQTKLKVRAR